MNAWSPFDPPTGGHPWVAVLDPVEGALDEAVTMPVFALDAAATGDLLTRLAILESRVAAVTLTALAHAGVVDLPAQTGASSTATWLAHATRTTRRDAFAQTRLAASLADEGHPAVRDALAVGAARVDQAQVILRAVEALPDDLDPALVAQAETYLVTGPPASTPPP